MAKWDERDPRWLVQNRDDGKNVGGWHWEEKNVMAWSKEQLEELMVGIPAAEVGGLKIRKLKSCTGEASITTRKGGKRLAIWDLNLTLEWAATSESSGKEVKGTIEVQEVSSAHDDHDDILFEFSAEGGGADADLFKGVAASLKPAILEALVEYGQRMHGLE